MRTLTRQNKTGTPVLPGSSTGRHAVKAAFFDVDGTLIRGDSQALEVRFRLRNRQLGGGYIRSVCLSLAALQIYRLGWISLTRQNEIHLKSYKGQTRRELARQADDLFRQVLRRQIHLGAMDLVETHRQQGDLIVLVSATTRHLLEPLETCLRPDYIFSTELEFDPLGRCTGQALNGICAEEKKAAMVRDFAGEHNLDLSLSYAYSDHHADLPLLSAAGHPVVVNPSRRLAGHARIQKWPICQFE